MTQVHDLNCICSAEENLPVHIHELKQDGRTEFLKELCTSNHIIITIYPEISLFIYTNKQVHELVYSTCSRIEPQYRMSCDRIQARSDHIRMKARTQ